MVFTNSPQIDSRRSVNGPGLRWVRTPLFLLAFLLASGSIWILVPELLRPVPMAFSTDPESAATNRSAAHLAAQFGVIRGDLWAASALAYSDVLGNRPEGQTSDTIEQARKITELALTQAPSDARIWLLLANINSRFNSLISKASAAVRMSYYTGRNESKLIPARLALSLRLPSIADPEFQQLASFDLRTVLRNPELKPAILDAYQNALPEGQRFLQAVLKELDPNLLATLPKNQ